MYLVRSRAQRALRPLMAGGGRGETDRETDRKEVRD